MKLYMFRTVPLSIIKSFSLCIQQWYTSYRFVDSLRAGSGWNSRSSIYVIQVCRQLASRIRMELMEFHPDPARKQSA